MFERAPRSAAADEFGLVEADHSFGEGIVIGVTAGADGADRARLRQTFGIADGQVLNTAVGVMDQPLELLGAAGPDRHLESAEGELGVQ